jgi:hypothetical protein
MCCWLHEVDFKWRALCSVGGSQLRWIGIAVARDARLQFSRAKNSRPVQSKVRSSIVSLYAGFYTVYYKDIGEFQILEHLYREASHRPHHSGLSGPAHWLVGGYFTGPPPWANSDALPSLAACGKPWPTRSNLPLSHGIISNLSNWWWPWPLGLVLLFWLQS